IWHYFDTMGREIRSIDALGFHTARTFDSFGNLTQTVEYANAGSGGTSGVFTPPATPHESSKDRITVFTYNALNQQVTVQRLGLTYVDANGNVVNKARNAATTVQTTTYDSMGRVRTVQDALGNITTTDYNALGQATQVTEPARVVANLAAANPDPFLSEMTV